MVCWLHNPADCIRECSQPAASSGRLGANDDPLFGSDQGVTMIWRVAIAALVLAAQAQVAQAEWVGSWSASPAPPQAPGANIRPERTAPVLEDQTLVQIVRLSAGGSALRIRFTNEYGQAPLVIGAARVSLLRKGASPGPGTVVSFAGADSITVPAGAPVLSDPIRIKTSEIGRAHV